MAIWDAPWNLATKMCFEPGLLAVCVGFTPCKDASAQRWGVMRSQPASGTPPSLHAHCRDSKRIALRGRGVGIVDFLTSGPQGYVL